MPRRSPLRRAGVTAAVVLASLTGACAPGASRDPAPDVAPPDLPGPPGVSAAPPGRPNVVFVLTDDLDTGLLRFMPNVAALAAQGTRFSDYAVADTLCCPSRASILTGRYPHDTGIVTNTAPDGGYDAFHAHGEDAATIGTSLQRAGYRTALLGKYLNGYRPGGTASAPGPVVPPGWNQWAVAGNGYGEYDYDLNENGRVVHHGRAPDDYLTDVLSRRAQDVVTSSARDPRPFFLEVATFAPHAPATPAPRDRGTFGDLQAPREQTFARPAGPDAPSWLRALPPLSAPQIARLDEQERRRARSVQAVDDLVGDLRATLERTGQAADTDIVVSSDNGFHLGQHGLGAGKQTAFDHDVVVPLIVAGPGVASRTVSTPAQNVDLAPTFADLAGAAPPPDVDGRSLAPLLAGQDPPDARTTALVEHRGPNVDPDDPDRAAGPNRSNPPTYTAIRDAAGTYVEYVTGEREYYDRRSDPAQQRNVAATLPPDRLATLHARLVALAQCHGTTCREADRS